MLLKTRFYIPPLRKHSVVRQGLIDKLNQSSGGQLVLVSAPAGYGKTTLVSQWLHANPHTFAWLVIDQSQSSPALFWEYVIGALQNVQPEIGQEALQLLKEADGKTLDPVVISLLNDLDELCTLNNASEPITLVLDDFHRIEDHDQGISVTPLVNLFLDHLPPSLRLVLTTRTEPSLALARRRANNQLLELDVKDLAFRLEEGRQFIKETMGLSLSDDGIQVLCDKSEGWAVGLQLAALALQRSGDSPESVLQKDSLNRHISDYLFDEVFSLQTESMQAFLIVTACVPRFCAGLCNALLDRQDSLSSLAQLDQLNLFLVPLDNHRTWFRYHDLFRQFLKQRFQEMTMDKVALTYRRAAEWFEAAGYLEDALSQYIALSDWDEALRLIEQMAVDKVQSGLRMRIQDWVKQFPASYQKRLQGEEWLTAITANDEKSAESTTEKPLENKEPENAAEVEPLTRRETQVMALVSKGYPNKQIATELNISLNTLKVHIRNLYGKMGVENRTQALLKMNAQGGSSEG